MERRSPPKSRPLCGDPRDSPRISAGFEREYLKGCVHLWMLTADDDGKTGKRNAGVGESSAQFLGSPWLFRPNYFI
jgi:hypothetical protein